MPRYRNPGGYPLHRPSGSHGGQSGSGSLETTGRHRVLVPGEHAAISPNIRRPGRPDAVSVLRDALDALRDQMSIRCPGRICGRIRPRRHSVRRISGRMSYWPSGMRPGRISQPYGRGWPRRESRRKAGSKPWNSELATVRSELEDVTEDLAAARLARERATAALQVAHDRLAEVEQAKVERQGRGGGGAPGKRGGVAEESRIAYLPAVRQWRQRPSLRPRAPTRQRHYQGSRAAVDPGPAGGGGSYDPAPVLDRSLGQRIRGRWRMIRRIWSPIVSGIAIAPAVAAAVSQSMAWDWRRPVVIGSATAVAWMIGHFARV